MDFTLTAHQIVLAIAASVLLLVIIILWWGILSLGRRTKLLSQKLDAPGLLSKTLKSTATLAEKIENGRVILQQVKDENASFSEKLRYVNAKLYPPVFKHDDSAGLKSAILECRKQQLTCILNGDAADSYSDWEWFGSKSDGWLMVTAYKELLISAFNAEFDTIRRQMRASTVSTARSKLTKLRDQLEKLSETVRCTITSEYFNLKLIELEVWAEELERKEQEKELKKAYQQKLREQNKMFGRDNDIEEVEDQLEFSKRDLAAAKSQARELAGLAAQDLDKQIAKLEKQIAISEEKIARAASEAQKTRAGFIYVISNIGSFGDGVVKIGMTRRLEPMDRVAELGDASVPFRFDVHTLAFVEDAPAIEKKLHARFSDRRLNKENHRKEFFRVSPQEVQEAIETMGVQSDWYFEVEAREYRETLSILAAKSTVPSTSAKFPESI